MAIDSIQQIEADVWFFDNDGTLYQNTEDIERAITQLMNRYMARIFNLNIEVAEKKRKELRLKHNTQFTLIALKNEGLSVDDFILSTYMAIEPQTYGIVANPQLRRLLISLSGIKNVLTNNPSQYAEIILKALGVRDIFSLIIGIQELGFIQKPARGAFAILEGLITSGKKVVFVDDDIENLTMAKILGCTTILVNNNPDILMEDTEAVDLWLPNL